MNETYQACNLCGAVETTVLFQALGYPILECTGCGLVRTGITVQPEQAEQFYRHEYYRSAAGYADSLKRNATAGNADDQERVRIVSRLRRKTAGRVLDVGCGAGALLVAFQRAGWECCGIEPSEELAACARLAAGCLIHTSALETAPLPAGTFDAITAIHVLEHSPDPLRFLHCCRRLLSPTGVLLAEVPDFGSRAARTQRESWPALYPNTHLFHFTRQTLSRMLEQAGLRPVRFRRYGGLGSLAIPPRAPGQAAPPSFPDRLKRGMFQSRLVFYRIPLLKPAARYLYWHFLRMNDAISICSIPAARTIDSRMVK